MVAQTVSGLEMVILIGYVLVVGYLGWLGWRRTRTASDYLLAGGKMHPFIMAMSYGAAFISTSAIVGFGGVAGQFGMSILWLVALNILVGVFIAFTVLGRRTRQMGHHLGAHTFGEFLGKRYQSRFVQVFAGSVVFLFIPLYASAVLIGGTEVLCEKFQISYDVGLLLLSAIVAGYVIVGGLKSAMYTDALQGSIMVIGMAILGVSMYAKLGGPAEAHRKLSELADLVPQGLQDIGHRGWTAFPEFGWGAKKYNLWWIMVSTIIMGVGIGVLAQPQLVVRFMTVKGRKEFNRALVLGSLFILLIPGVAYVTGSLSNAYFTEYGPAVTGQVTQVIDTQKGHVQLSVSDLSDATGPQADLAGKTVPVVLTAEDTQRLAGLASADPDADLPAQLGEARGRTISIMYAGKRDRIIPTFIVSAMDPWFAMLFLLILLAAAMTTLSGQFHALGSSVTRDVWQPLTGQRDASIGLTRIGIILGMIVAVLIARYGQDGTLIARGTALFFSLCSATFLPAYVGGLFFRRMTRQAAMASMVVGFAVSLSWLLLVKLPEAADLRVVTWLTGSKSLLMGVGNWPFVDSLFVGLPASILTALVVSLMTRPPAHDHLRLCFDGPAEPGELD